MPHYYFVGLMLTVSALEAINVAKSADNDIVLKVSADQQSAHDSHPFSGEWLSSPWGDLYQFRAGDQNWLTARERCLSLNADLVAIRNVEQLDWILSHYAPLSSRFAQRLVQIGLYAPEGQTHEWKWLNGEEINRTLQWSSGEPYDHSMEGRERCGLLNVEKRLLDDVDCESTPPHHNAHRYICQRTSENHKQQQISNNYIWQKIENLFSFFGIGASPTPHNATSAANDYEDEVKRNESEAAKKTAKFSDGDEETSSEEEESVAKTLASLPKIEGSGLSASLKEVELSEGSGQAVEKKAIEATADLIPEVDEKKLDKMIDKMEEMIKSIDNLTVKNVGLERTTVSTIEFKKEAKNEPEKTEEQNKEEVNRNEVHEQLNDNKVSESIEGDFDQEKTKDMPKADILPPKEEDCDNEGSGSGDEEIDKSAEKLELTPEKEDKIKEFLGVLRLFLDRAEHGDLRKLLDDQSGKTLLERMKNAVREANRREFEMLEKMESTKKSGNKEDLVKTLKKDQMSAEEQKDIYKKISTAVMKAAKLHKIEGIVHDALPMEKFNEAMQKADSEVKEEGAVELLKSTKEGITEKREKVGDDDYYGDYLDDNNVIKVQNRKKKEAKTDEPEQKEQPVKPAENSKSVSNDENKIADKEEKGEPKVLENQEESSGEEAKAVKEVENKANDATQQPSKKELEGSGIEESATSSIKPAEAEENEAELEASGEKEIPAVNKELPAGESKNITKTIEKQLVEDEPVAVTEGPKADTTTTISATTESSPKPTTTTIREVITEVTTTLPATVSMKIVSAEEIEKMSKMEAAEKVTLLPPLPTFTFPTLPPFTFPTLPTAVTTKPAGHPKVPTLEEILGSLNDQFKKLLAPPKALPPK